MGSRKTEHLLFITQADTVFSNGGGTGKGRGKDNSIWVNVAQDSRRDVCVVLACSNLLLYCSEKKN